MSVGLSCGARGSEPGEEDQRSQRRDDGGAQPFIQPRLPHVPGETEEGREVHAGEHRQRRPRHQHGKDAVRHSDTAVLTTPTVVFPMRGESFAVPDFHSLHLFSWWFLTYSLPPPPPFPPGAFRGHSPSAECPTDTGRQREPGFHYPW